MLDLRILKDGTGSTAAANLTTSPSGDGSPIAGQPFDASKHPTLEYVSFDQLVAGTPFTALKVGSTDLPDPTTGFDLGAAFPPDDATVRLGLKYGSGLVLPNYAQTAAAKLSAYLLWNYRGAGPCVNGYDIRERQPASYPQTLSALTAQTVTTQQLAAGTIPSGKYALLGFDAVGFTLRGAVRFTHNDWGAFRPGVPVTNANVLATLAGAGNQMWQPWAASHGSQFEALSEVLGVPCCPVFRAQTGTPSLGIEAYSNTADTVKLNVRLLKLA